jgi:S1-C subfamily serine protease
MRTTKLLCIAAALAICAMPAGADDEGPDTETLQQAVVNVWTVKADDQNHAQIGWGSGFVVSRDGYIVTNWHVVKSAKYVSVLLPGEAEPRQGENQNQDLKDLFLKGRAARVLYSSPARDLAVIKVETPLHAALTLADAPVTKNTKVYAIGYPGAAEDLFKAPTADPTVTSGVIGRAYSAPFHYGDTSESIPVIQHSAYINHGNSGGPLIDSCGRVVGVNTWISADEIRQDASGGAQLEANSGVYYASNAVNLISFLHSNNVPMDVASYGCSPGGMRGTLEYGLIGVLLAAVLSLALIMTFRKPRVVVMDAVNRSAEAVSRRISRRNPDGGDGARAPARSEATARVSPGAFRKLSFKGRDGAARCSFEITRNMLQRTHNGVVLGRLDNGVDLRIDHAEVSRRHARIFLSGAQVMIEDLGAMNGTTLNAVKLIPNAPLPLADGAVVTMGPLVFDVRME